MDLVCVKIKDGLYLGNRKAAADIEFLLTNKFSHVLNCTTELKNHFEDCKALTYCKLKYDKANPAQRLWGDSLRKLSRIIEFITLAEETGESCLIHSSQGNNRCFAVAIAYLMSKYKWGLGKASQFLNSKKAKSRLSQNFVLQLEALEEELKDHQSITFDWALGGHEDLDQMILVNTYLNTIKIQYEQEEKSQRDLRKVQWKDKLDKKARDKKSSIEVKRGTSKLKGGNHVSDQSMAPKKTKTKKLTPLIYDDHEAMVEPQGKAKRHTESLMSLLSQKVGEAQKRLNRSNRISEESDDGELEPDKDNVQSRVYNVTINNFINPTINMSRSRKKNNLLGFGKNPNDKGYSIHEKEDQRINRTFSQKQQMEQNAPSSLMKSLGNLKHYEHKERRSDLGEEYRSNKEDFCFKNPRLTSPKQRPLSRQIQKSSSVECHFKRK